MSVTTLRGDGARIIGWIATCAKCNAEIRFRKVDRLHGLHDEATRRPSAAAECATCYDATRGGHG